MVLIVIAAGLIVAGGGSACVVPINWEQLCRREWWKKSRWVNASISLSRSVGVRKEDCQEAAATKKSPLIALVASCLENSIILLAMIAIWSIELVLTVGAWIDCTWGGSCENNNFQRKGLYSGGESLSSLNQWRNPDSDLSPRCSSFINVHKRGSTDWVFLLKTSTFKEEYVMSGYGSVMKSLTLWAKTGGVPQ